MITFLSCQDKEKIKNIYLVHGELEAQHAFSKHLWDAGFKNVEIPKLGTSIEIV
jgi:metallo-beta-lactamase family protein